MTDPLAQVIRLLMPKASFSKLVTGAGLWAVQPPGRLPFYCAVLEGQCELTIKGREPVMVAKGDFILVPASHSFTMTSLTLPPHGLVSEPVEVRPGEFHLGAPGTPDVRMLVGHCVFASNDAALLVSLLPEFVIVRGERRLTALVELLRDEASGRRPGRETVLTHLLEVLLIEAFRATTKPLAAPGLLRGLADEQLAAALTRMHAEPGRPWTIGDLAKEAAFSRSTFFGRFRREVGIAPMEYLLGWRMAVAKDLLRGGALSVSEVARRVGYSSASTFSVAFSRHEGFAPGSYARGKANVA